MRLDLNINSNYIIVFIYFIGDIMYKNIKIFIVKSMLTIVITLVLLIMMKSSGEFKTQFYKNVYETNFSFTKINNLYNRYFGNVISLPKNPTEPVFNEKLIYSNKETYFDGVVLNVEKNYMIPIQESGLVVFIGEKENYGNVVIIQQVNGIDMWYGNVDQVDVKLYDYVEKGTLLGECNNKLYLLFKQNGEILDYEKYL